MSNTTDQNLVDLLTYARKPIINVVDSPEHTPSVFVPHGYVLEPLEHLLPQPLRKRAGLGIFDVDSFIEYIKLHKTSHTSAYVRADYKSQTLVAVCILDGHASNVASEETSAPVNGAGWSEHVARFTPEKTPEWIKWNSNNGSQMTQVEFAAFIEDNLPDIQSVDKSPSGAEMLAMALNFEANYDKKFISKVNNQSGGITMEFKSTDDKETVSRMELFSRFTTGLKVFFNGEAFPLEARLKYKASQGELKFWYELIRPERVFLAACASIVTTIKEQTQVPVINAIPFISREEILNIKIKS